MRSPATAVLLACLTLPGCDNGNMTDTDLDGGGDGGPLAGLQSLSISPANPTVTVSPGSPQTLIFTVTGTFPSGTRDVTQHVQLSLQEIALGSFSGATLTTTDSQGGKTLVVASAAAVTAQTGLTVKISLRSSAANVPSGAQDLFDKAHDGTGPGPALVYPPSGVLLPPNLGELEVMWTDGVGNDLWELAIENDITDIKIYTSQPRHRIADAEWRVLAATNPEGQVAARVRGLVQASPTTSSRSGDISILFARDTVRGGLYYWAATSDGGIIRYDFGKTGQKAEAFFTKADAGDCVACHALSSDGTRMAVTFTGGDGAAGILDVAKRTLTANKTYYANFQVYTPDNKHLITSSAGVLSVRDPVVGTELAQLDTGGKATMPDVSPDGSWLAFVRPTQHNSDWIFTGGNIVTAPLSGTALGQSQVLVQGSSAQNNYYPAYSPDGKWIIFNRSTGDSYSDDDAALHVVSATGGAPLELVQANQGLDLRNSWARWSPFVQTYNGHKLLWLTFSSTRDYGTALINSTQPTKQRNPQLWMTAFDPDRAGAGQDPSFPAFWLPFQDMATNNHIAQWTQKVVAVE